MENPDSFKGYDEGDFYRDRGYGVYKILGSKKFQGLVVKSYELTRDAGYLGFAMKTKKEGTRGRSLQQAAFHFLKIAILDLEDEGARGEFENSQNVVNKGLFRGFQITLPAVELDPVYKSFKEIGIKKPKSSFYGYSPETLPEIIRFLAKSKT